MKKLTAVLAVLAATPFMVGALAVDVENDVYIKYLGHDSLALIVGGACTDCLNYCSSNSFPCSGDNCEGSGDDGELCGVSSGSMVAWGCRAGSGNCTPDGYDVTCRSTLCHCDGTGTCWTDFSDTTNSGKISCTD